MCAVGDALAMVCVCARARELFVSCHHVNPGDQSEVIRPDGRCLYPLGYLLSSNSKYA